MLAVPPLNRRIENGVLFDSNIKQLIQHWSNLFKVWWPYRAGCLLIRGAGLSHCFRERTTQGLSDAASAGGPMCWEILTVGWIQGWCILCLTSKKETPGPVTEIGGGIRSGQLQGGCVGLKNFFG